MADDYFDRATITVKSGGGGNGAATFRREKFVPLGGPNGGDGGRGGHVYLVADPELNTLLSFRYERKFVAESGGNGQKNKMYGRHGDDLVVRVPPGTVVRATIDGEQYEIDLARPGQRLLAARGGKGGLGNVHFTSSTRQAPRIAELGEPGQQLELELELKLIADVGLVGFPNAGKSTLLSVVSAAKPKIANYPFTTLQPNLGIADVGRHDRFVVADIPGLIEGAHAGVGLGHDFLRHVERTRLLIHVVDAAGTEGRDPAADFRQINEELRLYQPGLAERPQLVALNKHDLPDAQAYDELLRPQLIASGVAPGDIFTISAATNQGIGPLINRMAEYVRSMGSSYAHLPHSDEVLTFQFTEVDPNSFWLEEEEDEVIRVHGAKIERLVSMTNFAQPEALDRLQRVLQAMGVSDSLQAAGVQTRDIVRIEKAELVWTDESSL